MGDPHAAIWSTLDRLAEDGGVSRSGLARAAGLDATSFNPSKRIGAAGNKRWPSTETIAAVLAVSGMSWEEFGREVDRA